MGTLGFERGASTLGQQLQFQNEFDQIVAAARENGAADDPALRQRLADIHIRLRLMRLNALRTLHDAGGAYTPAAEAVLRHGGALLF